MQHLSFSLIILIFKLSRIKAWNLEVFPSFRCIILDSSASFNCLNNTNEGNALYPNNVQWFKVLTDGGLNPISRSTEARIRSDGHQLRITSVIAEDEGIYCCKALTVDRGCSQTAMTNISVALPPVISYLPDQNVSTGDTVVIECILNYTGKPAATLTSWQIFGIDIIEDEKYEIIQSSNATSLTITNVTKEDTGSYNCITYNSKYQQDNQSMLLLVNEISENLMSSIDNTSSSITPCGMTESYPITIGLHIITGDCNVLQDSKVHDVINNFLFSLCNCSNYCITVNYVTACSSDNNFIITTVAIKGEQALSLQNKTYTTLHRANATVEFQSNVYYLFCVITELCGDAHVTSDNNDVTVTSAGETKNEISDQVIILASLILTLILIITSLLILIITLVVKSKKNFSQAAKCRLQKHSMFEKTRNETVANTLPNLKLNTTTHSYEDPDITSFNPTYYGTTLTQIATGSNSNTEVVLHAQLSCASNDDSQNSCIQASNSIKCTCLPEMQKPMESGANHISPENNNTHARVNTAAHYDDTVIGYHDNTVSQSNKTKNHSNYAKLQHKTTEANERPTDDNEEIKWVTNPQYKDVPLAHVTAYSSKNTPLTSEVADETHYEDTEVNYRSCRNLHNSTKNAALSENDDNVSSTTWDRDRSSYVTGYSPQFKLPSTKSLTVSTYREGGNEVPINPMSLSIPAVSICEWNATNV